MNTSTLPNEAIAYPSTFTDPAKLHGLLARIRREDPLPFIEADDYRPFWLVSRHSDILEVERNSAQFINAPRQALLPLSYEKRARDAAGGVEIIDFSRNVIQMDGDEHKAYRNITQSYFTPKGLQGVIGDIDKLAAEFIGRMDQPEGEIDFANVAMAFPLRVVMTMLGVPPEDEPMMLSLTQQTLSSQDPEFQKEGGARAAMVRMYDYFKKIIEDLRVTPDNTLASVISNARINGELLSDRDVYGYFNIAATAGHDTTSYSLTTGTLAFLESPEQLAQLRADPALMPLAVEEVLRWSTPVKHFCRTAVKDCVIAGKQVKAGDLLLLSFPSGSFDESIYEDPYTFRIDRRPNRHLAFGTGPHVCLGQFLARYELSSFFRELLDKVEHLELAGTPRYVEGSFVGGVKYLPVRYRLK